MESKLIEGLLSGHEEDVDCVRSWIRGSLNSYRTRLEGELEDLEQEVLVDLIDALGEGRFGGRCTLHTYVRTFTHHKCIDRIRVLSRRTMLDVEELDLPTRDSSVFEHLSKKEDLLLALQVFQQMPENCRELWQAMMTGKKYKEISLELGVSEGSLRARVLRCRRRALELRKKLIRSSTASNK